MINVGIVDIGTGNLYNLIKCLKEIEVNTTIVDNSADLKNSDALIIPGVGAFKSGMDTLMSSRILEDINIFAEQKKPILGICLGMQLLLNKSYEFGIHNGMNLIQGIVKPIKKKRGWPIPNIGWCKVDIKKEAKAPFKNLMIDTHFYFIHSYYCDVQNKKNVVGTIYYGDTKIPAIIQNDNIIGCQFHPELSDTSGFQIIENFVKLI